MIYDNVSSKVVIARVLTDFGPDYTDWQTKAPLWIADALDLMSAYPTTHIAEPITVEVENHKFKLPCDIRVLLAIEYEGNRVERISTTNPTTDSTIDDTCIQYQVLNNGYCWFSKATGDITIHYKTSPVVLDNELKVYLPLVPNDTKVILAIGYYIMAKMLQSGYKHPIFDLNSQNPFTNPMLAWNSGLKAARNSIGKMDSDERNLVSQMIRNFITNPYSHYTDSFNNLFAK